MSTGREELEQPTLQTKTGLRINCEGIMLHSMHIVQLYNNCFESTTRRKHLLRTTNSVLIYSEGQQNIVVVIVVWAGAIMMPCLVVFNS